MLREIFVYCDNHMKHTNTLHGMISGVSKVRLRMCRMQVPLCFKCLIAQIIRALRFRHNSLVSVVTSRQISSFRRHLQTGLGSPSQPINGCTIGQRIKQITHLYILLGLCKLEAILPLPHTSLWLAAFLHFAFF